MSQASCPPDLSQRPYELTVECIMPLRAEVLYGAWTEQFDRWFAKPGSVLMKPEVNVPFFFATDFDGALHSHYGRFLRLTPDRLVELTWVTGQGGTEGAETVVTVELAPSSGDQTHVRLTHSGFTTEDQRDRHRDAWPLVLKQLEQRLTDA